MNEKSLDDAVKRNTMKNHRQLVKLRPIKSAFGQNSSKATGHVY